MTAYSSVLAAFDRLAEYNTVSLADLRGALTVSSVEFNCELYRLRKQGILSLSTTDRQMSQRDRMAAIEEHGEVFTNVHRRQD